MTATVGARSMRGAAGHCGQILGVDQAAASDVNQQALCLQEVSTEERTLDLCDNKIGSEGLMSQEEDVVRHAVSQADGPVGSAKLWQGVGGWRGHN